MSDLKLSDGREVDIDLYQISMKEYRDWFFNPQVEDEVADSYMAKVTGINDASDLPQPDYRMLVSEVYAKSLETVSDPNSSGGSNSIIEKGSKSQSD